MGWGLYISQVLVGSKIWQHNMMRKADEHKRKQKMVICCWHSLASQRLVRPLTANLRWRPFSSVPHVSDRLELHNNNRASWILHPGPSESDVYSDVVEEARWNDLLHTARLLMRLDTPLHRNNARGAIYAVYYASVERTQCSKILKWLRSERCRRRNVAVP